MGPTDVIGVIGDIATILALLAGGWLATFVFVQFAPVLTLRILPTWLVEESQWINLHIEVENKSRIRVYKKAIYLQVLEHTISEGGSLSEWVPFEEKAIIRSEQPVNWHEPIEIFQSTKSIDPGEVLVVERLHYCPPNSVLHVGLQVRAKLGLFGRVAARVRDWKQQWTTTRIVMK